MTELVNYLKSNKKVIVVSESITGGGISSAITNIPGSSKFFWGGFVTYSNESKNKILGVKKKSLDKFGAVSKEVALEMAQGALSLSGADYSLSITGYAGPKTDEDKLKVGTIFIGYVSKDGVKLTKELCLNGSRQIIRESAVQKALSLFKDIIFRIS